MKRSSVLAALLAGLSLCGLTCQRSGQTTGGGTGAVANNTAGGPPAGTQQPSVPQTQLKVGDRAPVPPPRNALQEAEEEAASPTPRKDEVGKALERAVDYACSAKPFALLA